MAMTELYNILSRNRVLNEDEYIVQLRQFLSNGSDIDEIYSEESATILHLSIKYACEKIVKFALNSGARIENE